MLYYILSDNNEHLGPFTIDEMRQRNVQKTTKVRTQGKVTWVEAQNIASLRILFQQSTISTRYNKTQGSYQANYNYQYTIGAIYNDYFDVKKLSEEEKSRFKLHFFSSDFPIVITLLLHFFTCGIFTLFFCAAKHGSLPKIKSDDFGSGKAIGFLFIPIYNIYWLFMVWRRLAQRINLQFKLREKPQPISLGLATTVAIITLIPYLGIIINYFILYPIILFQIQDACNKLAKENREKGRYF